MRVAGRQAGGDPCVVIKQRERQAEGEVKTRLFFTLAVAHPAGGDGIAGPADGVGVAGLIFAGGLAGIPVVALCTRDKHRAPVIEQTLVQVKGEGIFRLRGAQGIPGAHRHLRGDPEAILILVILRFQALIPFPGVERIAKAVITLSGITVGRQREVGGRGIDKFTVRHAKALAAVGSVLQGGFRVGNIHRYCAERQIPAGADKPGLIIIAHDRAGITGYQVIKAIAQRGLQERRIRLKGVLMDFPRHHAVLAYALFKHARYGREGHRERLL